jgi:serine/threonine-protein kinase
MGTVWRATDTRLRRAVALKFLPPQLSSDPKTKARFIREAQTASALDHPNIATVYEIGEHGDSLYIAMALYEGDTLQQRIARSPIPFNEIETILTHIALGLGAAHSAGIIHRDLKPANVMITRSGLVKILDFGLAKLVSASDSEGQVLTKTGHVMGTVSYMSPQQAEGRPLDHRTDLWSLGVVAYEMLCRQRPFDSDYTGGTLARILVAEPPLPSSLRPGVPPRLDGLVAKLLRKNPDARPQNAAEVLAELSPSGSYPGVGAPAVEPDPRRPRARGRQTKLPKLAVRARRLPCCARPGPTRRLWIAVTAALILAALQPWASAPWASA